VGPEKVFRFYLFFPSFANVDCLFYFLAEVIFSAVFFLPSFSTILLRLFFGGGVDEKCPAVSPSFCFLLTSGIVSAVLFFFTPFFFLEKIAGLRPAYFSHRGRFFHFHCPWECFFLLLFSFTPQQTKPPPFFSPTSSLIFFYPSLSLPVNPLPVPQDFH